MSCCLGILALALFAASASAQTFAPAKHHVMGPGPVGLVVTDLDGDALLDVATANGTEVTASIRLGDGAGGLGAESSQPLPGLIEALDLAAGDVTGDGLPDLVAGGDDGSTSALVVLRAQEDAPYSPVTYHFPCCLPGLGNLQLADFDGDSQLDVVGAARFDSKIYVALNDAGALIFASSFSSVLQPCQDLLCIEAVTGLDAADIDADGDLDLACTNLLDDSFVAFSNLGDGLFALAEHAELHVPLNDLLLADVDEDGHVDALASDPTQGVLFLAGDGAFSFASPVVSSIKGGVPFVTGPTSLALADLDGDGRQDVAAGHSIGPTHDVLVAKGRGAGSFGPAVPAGALAALPTRLEAADLDRDGRLDLVVTEPGTSQPAGDTIALLLNTTEPAPPWNDTGFALAGELGAPYLMTFGPLIAGSAVKLSLSGAKPGAHAVLVLGFSELYARFKGGALVPFPNLLLGAFFIEPDGGLALSSRWPPGVPGNTLFGVQWWITDAGGPQGFASSNGVLGLTP